MTIRLMRACAIGVALILAAISATREANATPVSWDFQIQVDYVVRSSGVTVSVGDTLSGKLSFDTFTPQSSFNGRVANYALDNQGLIAATVDGTIFSRSINLIQVINDCVVCGYLDRLFVNAGPLILGDVNGIQFWIDGGNDGSNAFSNLLTSFSLPTDPPNLALVSGSNFVIRIPELDVSGHITSLSNSATVPEPSTLALIAIAMLSLFGFVLMRHHQAH